MKVQSKRLELAIKALDENLIDVATELSWLSKDPDLSIFDLIDEVLGHLTKVSDNVDNVYNIAKEEHYGI